MQKFYLITALVILNFLSWQIIYSWFNFSPTVSFLNVGQGNATLIKDRGGNILIDAGKNNGRVLTEKLKVLPYFKNKIDVAIITHADTDHYGGFFDLFQIQKPGLVIYNGGLSKEETFKNFLAIVKEKDIPLIDFKAGDKILTKNSVLQTLAPENYNAKTTDKNDNQNSLIFKIRQNQKLFLLMSDADFSVEKTLEDKVADLKSDVLQIGHHGSKYSTGENFLKLVRPNFAVISVGKNPYGHPTKETILRLEKNNTLILRTDLDGTISFEGADYKLYK